MQKLLTFFQQKIQHICVLLGVNVNKSLTNDVVSFEQLVPDVYLSIAEVNSINKSSTVLS